MKKKKKEGERRVGREKGKGNNGGAVCKRQNWKNAGDLEVHTPRTEKVSL